MRLRSDRPEPAPHLARFPLTKPKRKRKRLDLWMFALMVCVCLAGPWIHDPLTSLSSVTAVYLATVAATCAGMGFWLGFGESILRFVLIPFGLVQTACSMTMTFRTGVDAEALTTLGIFCVMTTMVVAGPISIVRAVRHGRLTREGLTVGEDSVEVLRFSIWHILVFMTAIAILSVLGKALFASGLSTSSDYLMVTLLGLTLGVCSIVVVWATLGRAPAIRTVTSLLVAVGLAFANSYIESSSIGWFWIAVTMILWLQITILMWLVRGEGYRFVTSNREV